LGLVSGAFKLHPARRAVGIAAPLLLGRGFLCIAAGGIFIRIPRRAVDMLSAMMKLASSRHEVSVLPK
jgi:hypothetical protein